MHIHELAFDGDIAGMKKMLANNTEIDTIDTIDTETGKTPLMYAVSCREDNLDMIRFLIENGADINAVEVDPEPPNLFLDNLPEEMREEMREEIEKLQNQASQFLERGKTVFYHAVVSGSIAKVEYLISEGADLHYIRPDKYDVLIDCLYGKVSATKFKLVELLIKHGAKVNEISSHDESAISVASRFMHFDIVKLLIDAGADLEQLEWEPLMYAIACGTVENVHNILEKGLFDIVKDRFSRTPFHLAIQTGNIEKAELLLSYGSDLEERGQLEMTGLHYASTIDNPKMLTWLLDQGVEINAIDNFANTPLINACTYGMKDNVRILLNAGAELSIANESGETALTQATDPSIAAMIIDLRGDWSETSDELRRKLTGLPESGTYRMSLSQEELEKNQNHRFGRKNPEVMDIRFWREMVKSGYSAGSVEYKYNGLKYRGFGNPIWSYDRFGKSITILPDGRLIEIAGEHEDYYDENFCIYNDVFVFDGKGNFTIYGYPEGTFQPTDFHTATYYEGSIYIIGNLGYQKERLVGVTPVYQLNTDTFAIKRLKTTGNKPGWIFRHKAKLTEDGKIIISEGEINQQEGFEKNEKEFILNLQTLIWE